MLNFLNATYTIDRTTPPSTRRAAPLVADDKRGGEAKNSPRFPSSSDTRLFREF